jgi:hypothetical protein
MYQFKSWDERSQLHADAEKTMIKIGRMSHALES